MTHDLKTWPIYFAAILTGEKTFEVRRDNRGFAVGDTLLLNEWCPDQKEFTGRSLRKRVSYILGGGRFGVQHGTVVMSLAPVIEDPAQGTLL